MIKEQLVLEEINSKGRLLQDYIRKSNFDGKALFSSSLLEASSKNAIVRNKSLFDPPADPSHLDPPAFLDILLSKLNVEIVNNTSNVSVQSDDIISLQVIASLFIEIANSVFTILENPESRSQSFGGSIFAGIFQLLMWLRENSRQGEIMSDAILEIIELKLLNGLAATIFTRNASTRPTSMGDVVDIPLDDTTGWRHLEAYLYSFQKLILTYLDFGRSFPLLSSLPPSVLTIIKEKRNADSPMETIADLVICYASTHVNRYIREMTLRFIEQLFSSHFTQDISNDSRNLFVYDSKKHFSSKISLSNVQCRLFSNISTLLPMVVLAVSRGLEDDWSQIRLVATKACRALLIGIADRPLPSQGEKEEVGGEVFKMLCWPSLLPRVCMNRYYAAEAVKTASLNIWKDFIAVRFDGKALLAQHCAEAVQYYIDSSQKSTNHMVCEAACHAMGEIASRINPTYIEPYIPRILLELRCRLDDERWPVSDAACCAIGAVVAAYPALYLRTVSVREDDVMVKLLSKQLLSCIPSVRDNAAVAMGKFMSCFLEPSLRMAAIEKTMAFVQENLLLLQIVDSSLPVGTVLPLQGEEGMIVGRSGQVMKSFLPVSMLSSGAGGGTGAGATIAPSRGSRARWSCCIDCVELRTCDPWERSHGAVCLVREAALSSMMNHPRDEIFQELLRPLFSPDLRYCSLLPAPLLTTAPMSIVDALWLILSHRLTAPVVEVVVLVDDRQKPSRSTDPSLRNKIRNLEKLQAAVYNEAPLILLGFLPGRKKVEDLASCDCISDDDVDILREINFHRCIEAYLSDVREFKALSSLKQVAVEEAAVKLNLFLHEELLHSLLK